MSDRKTDAAESLEDLIAFNSGKTLQDTMRVDKGIDMASSAAIAQAITNAGTLQHQITQNAVLVGNLTNLMTVGGYALFLKQLLGVDVQTILEAALMKASADAMANATPETKPESG